jgi:hypothetical protein
MINVTDKDKIESISSLQSSIRKTEKSLAQMNDKGVSTILVRKRLEALNIGLDILESTWNKKPNRYAEEDLKSAQDVLERLLPGIIRIYEKSKLGSPQRTLLERRIKSLELAIEEIGNQLGHNAG